MNEGPWICVVPGTTAVANIVSNRSDNDLADIVVTAAHVLRAGASRVLIPIVEGELQTSFNKIEAGLRGAAAGLKVGRREVVVGIDDDQSAVEDCAGCTLVITLGQPIDDDPCTPL